MAESILVEKSRKSAEQILSELPAEYSYHNVQHTREVVNATEKIADEMGIDQEARELLLVAAWFHDTGYECGFENHEQESIKLMKKKLLEWKVAPEKIHDISRIIESTKMPQLPQDELGKILCDADLFHLSTPEFLEKSELLRRELNDVCGKDLPTEEWQKVTAIFLNQHKYFTNYGKTILEPRKQKNLKELSGDKKGSKKADKKYVSNLEKEIVKLKNKIDRDKIRKPDRGIETMFRITSKNHLQLSAMADNKANIMISINSIILSVLVSILFRKFEEYPNLIVPAMLLVTVCLTTIVFAVLATRPNVSSGTFTREDIINKKTNLLFFGNFHSMQLENYMWGMKEMMKDADYLYGSMTKDIYFLGIVLGKKYRMLRKSYNVFMFGFVISIIAFIVAMLFFPANH